MKSEDNNREAGNIGFKKETNDHTNEISTGSVGNENHEDNGASTLRELRRKHAGTSSSVNKTRRPLL